MNWKKVVKIIFFIQLIFLAGLYIFFSGLKMKTTRVVLGNVESLFPAGHYRAYQDGGWQGYLFPYRFRFLYQDFTEPSQRYSQLVEKNFQTYYLKKKLPLFDQGTYVIRKKSKGYLLFCLFRKGKRVFWLDVNSPSTLTYIKDGFDTVLRNLIIDGQAVSAEALVQLQSMNNRISPLVIQNPLILIVFMAGVFLIVLAVISVIMTFAGACPVNEAGAVEFCSKNATLIIRKMGRKGIPCCICKEGEYLVVYRFKKEYLRIHLSRQSSELYWKKNRLHFQHYSMVFSREDLPRWQIVLPAVRKEE